MKQETDTIATGPIVAALVATIVLTTACILWVSFVMGDGPPPDPQIGKGAPAVDRTLFPDEGPGYAAERNARKRAAMNEWGWADAQKKTVRMPIARAMKLVVERRP